MVIGACAFQECTLLQDIVIPPAIRRIKYEALFHCSELAIAIIGEGHEEIGDRAFYHCTLLHEIVIPPTVRVIMCGALKYFSGLTTVILSKGLEEIGRMAFQEFTSLHEIVIPPSVRAIKERAFYRCLGLIRKKALPVADRYVRL